MDERLDGVQARPAHRLLGREALVEDPGDRLEQRASEPRPAGGAGRELEAGAVEDDHRRHHARHPLAGNERSLQQVGLAEHAVQVQIETGQEVA